MESTMVEKNNNYFTHDKINNTYGDDSDKEQDLEGKSRFEPSPNKFQESDDDIDVITPAPTKISSPVHSVHQKLRNPGSEKAFDKPSETDSEPEMDAVNLTEDQERAMLELMAQTEEEADFLDEEPPEYNVKGRLEQLNAELANDPTPVDKNRELRVGFKAEIVDIVAPPPPDYSDDDDDASQSSGIKKVVEQSSAGTKTPSKSISSNSESNKENVVDLNKKQFVVERDGQFSLLSATELSPSERAVFINNSANERKTDKQNDLEQSKGSSFGRSHSAGSRTTNSVASTQIIPRPPMRPRPKTANSTPRKNVHLRQTLTSNSVSLPPSSNSCLDNLNYSSPYAMTAEQKTEAREKARRNEKEKQEKEKKKKEEEEERRKESDTAFQAWLDKKKDEKKSKQGSAEDKQKSEQERKDECEQAYRSWLREKKAQGKREKLLKRRQQQEKTGGLFLRSEECERAVKEWLKKKNAESKQLNCTEKQTNRIYRVQMKRSKQMQTLIKVLREAQTSHYLDHCGCTF